MPIANSAYDGAHDPGDGPGYGTAWCEASWTLPTPIVVGAGNAALTTRRCCYLRRGGVVTEASPLPGFSPDTIDEVVDALRRRRHERHHERRHERDHDGLPAELPPALAFALAMLSQPATPAASDPILALGLHILDDARAHLLADARGALDAVASARLVGDGAVDDFGADRLHKFDTCWKIKMGRRSLAEDVSRVRRVAGGARRIRLDGNRRLDASSALTLADAAGDALDFFEEPGEPAVAEVLRQHGIPVALDESLDDAVAANTCDLAALRSLLLQFAEYRDVWIVKPAMLGDALPLVLGVARTMQCPIVISSLYESAVGLRVLRALAAAVDDTTGQPRVHGLGTQVFGPTLDKGGAQPLKQAWDLAGATPWEVVPWAR